MQVIHPETFLSRKGESWIFFKILPYFLRLLDCVLVLAEQAKSTQSKTAPTSYTEQ